MLYLAKKIVSIILIGCCVGVSFAQTSILNATFNEYNASISALSQITLSSQIEGRVKIEVMVTNVANITLLKLISNEVTIKKGITNLNATVLTFNQVIYNNHPQANYLKTFNQLPSGIFNHCVTIIPVQNIEEPDNFCQTIDATEKEQLYLINPADEEEIETPTPLLIWFHSEPFNLLNQGEYFRLVLVELNQNQSPASGITANVPYFIQNNLTRHQVQYPLDAKPLQYGKNYAWQVQKMANGNIVTTTEVWQFTLPKKNLPNDNKYVIINKKIDGSVYNATNDKIFFKFEERYNESNLSFRIRNEKNEVLTPKNTSKQATEESFSDVQQPVELTKLGPSQYELDLKPYKLKKGYYVLEIINEKQNKYQLKFYVE